MKNKLATGLLSVFGFVVLLITLTYCNSDSDARPDSIKAEQLKIERVALATFVAKYEIFINSLSPTHKDLLTAYINKEDALAENAKVNVVPECNCPPNSGTCSAEGAFSSCCTCWNPATQSGSCNTLFGFSSCKVENNNPPAAKAEQPKREFVKLYPKRFSDMLDYLSSNGIKITGIRAEFVILVNSAE